MKKIINLNLLSLSRPTCKSAIFNSLIGLICCFFLFSYIALLLDPVFSPYHVRFTVIDYVYMSLWLIFALLIGIPVILHFIGEVIWQVKGVEIIQYDERHLYIYRKGRIIGKSKKIPWTNIKNIEEAKLSLYEQFIIHFSVEGKIDERLQILRYKGRKIYCGVNLSQEECERVIVAVQELMK